MANHETEQRPVNGDLSGMKLFAGNANRDLGHRVAEYLGVELGKITSTKFSDGEIRLMVDESARGNDIFIIQPTCQPVNDSLMELLIMLDAFRRASARRLTVVMPYYGYARQDKKVKPREPITARLVADLIIESGANRVVAVDLHAEQIQGFFDVPVDHLYAAPVLNEHFVKRGLVSDEVVVVSPDEGSIKRASGHAKRLGGKLAIVDKRRATALKTKQENIIGGPVAGRVALMFDDMISTAGSICGAARLVHDAGAREIHVAATHGVLCGPAIQNIQSAPITSLVITNSIPLRPDQAIPQIEILTVAPLLAEAIKRIHHDQSVSAMFGSGSGGTE